MYQNLYINTTIDFLGGKYAKDKILFPVTGEIDKRGNPGRQNLIPSNWRDRQAWEPRIFMPNMWTHKNPKNQDPPTLVKSGGMRWEFEND